MLAALKPLRYRLPETRIALGLAAALLAVVGFGAQLLPTNVQPVTRAIADELKPASWAMTLPASWLAATPPRARYGDAFDLLAIRPGDRAAAVPVAFDVVLVASDDRGLTLEVDEADAVAITNAHGSGMQLIALLRSTR